MNSAIFPSSLMGYVSQNDASRSLTEASFRAVSGVFGPFWAYFKGFWAILGLFLGVLGHFGYCLRGFWAILVLFQGVLGHFGYYLKGFWTIIGLFQRVLGHLGLFQEVSGHIRAISRGFGSI